MHAFGFRLVARKPCMIAVARSIRGGFCIGLFCVRLQTSWTWPAAMTLSSAQTPSGEPPPSGLKLKLDLEGTAAAALGLGLTSTGGEGWGRMEHGNQVLPNLAL